MDVVVVGPRKIIKNQNGTASLGSKQNISRLNYHLSCISPRQGNKSNERGQTSNRKTSNHHNAETSSTKLIKATSSRVFIFSVCEFNGMANGMISVSQTWLRNINRNQEVIKSNQRQMMKIIECILKNTQTSEAKPLSGEETSNLKGHLHNLLKRRVLPCKASVTLTAHARARIL